MSKLFMGSRKKKRKKGRSQTDIFSMFKGEHSLIVT